MISVTFPDGNSRPFEPGVSGADVAKSISPSLLKRTVAMNARRRAVGPVRRARSRRQDRVSDARGSPRPRTHPPRCRACDGRGRAVAVARHAGDDRPGDRERLLLRLRARRAVHAGGLRGDRQGDAPDHREGPPLHEGVLDAGAGQGLVQGEGRGVQDRTRRHDQGRRRPEDLQAGRVAGPLSRPAHDVDGQDRAGLQADEGRRRLLAGRFQPADAPAHLCHSLRQPGRPRRLPATSWRRRNAATTVGSAARWTCSTSRRRDRERSSGIPRAGRCSRPSSATCAGARTRPAMSR